MADDPAHQVVALGEARHLRGRPPVHPNLRLLGYDVQAHDHRAVHHYLRDVNAHVRRGQIIARALLRLKQQGFTPDVVTVHPGWGEGLFVRDIFPAARHVQYFEYYYHGQGGDVGFDPEFPASLDDQLRVKIKNTTQLHSLATCDHGIAPTTWQKSRFPELLQAKIQVIHEGIDTTRIAPDPGAWIRIGNEILRAGDEIVTFVARNLEPYRGFHTFMRSLPALLALRPRARVLIVGGDDVSYGQRPPGGTCYRAQYCAQLAGQYDSSRVHFLGKLPYADYLRVLQVSAAHVYLTYPFVLSWSMLEAMSAGCLVVGSRTPPVLEVLTHGINGWLVDFFDSQAMAATIAGVLANPDQHQELRKQARQTIIDRYDLKNVCLPQMLALLNTPSSAAARC